MRRAALAIMLAPALLLTGCVQWFLPPQTSSTSTPTDESVSAELEPYYRQSLVWEVCGNGLQETWDHVRALVAATDSFEFASEVAA